MNDFCWFVWADRIMSTKKAEKKQKFEKKNLQV